MDNDDVKKFMKKFDVPMASEPSFLDLKAAKFRVNFMAEELSEFVMAYQLGDMHGAADALVDLVYVAHGTALMMGIPWQEAWDEVQRANMSKIKVENAEGSKRKSSLDIVKPTGWIPPDHAKAVGYGPWPVFETGAV